MNVWTHKQMSTGHTKKRNPSHFIERKERQSSSHNSSHSLGMQIYIFPPILSCKLAFSSFSLCVCVVFVAICSFSVKSKQTNNSNSSASRSHTLSSNHYRAHRIVYYNVHASASVRKIVTLLRERENVWIFHTWDINRWPNSLVTILVILSSSSTFGPVCVCVGVCLCCIQFSFRAMS